MALKHNITDISKVKLIKELCDSNNFNISKDKHYKKIDDLIKEVEKRSFVRVEVLDKFEKIKDEIKHYEQVSVAENKKDEIEEEIKNTNSSKKDKTSMVTDARYKYLKRHYYNPLICEENSMDFSHIIKVKSEIRFLEALDDLSEKIDKEVKWWFFSKIEENVDSVYIPYIQDAKDKKFYPDFIFWIEKKDGTQKIVFVDPKGTQNTAYEFKCDGFKNIFDIASYDKKCIEVQLWLIKDDKPVSEGYAKYWIDIRNEKELMQIFQ